MFKCWGVLFVCLGTKAVSIWAAPTYSTKDFILCYHKQTNIYGDPKVVISDHGSQLIAASEDLIDWKKIAHDTAPKGTTWQFSPKGCPWRNDMAERCIGLAKKVLMQVVNKHQTLNFAELEGTFLKVAKILNQRRLTARHYTEDNYVAY